MKLKQKFAESPRIVWNSFGALVKLKEGDPMNQRASLSVINGLHALIIRQCAASTLLTCRFQHSVSQILKECRKMFLKPEVGFSHLQSQLAAFSM